MGEICTPKLPRRQERQPYQRNRENAENAHVSDMVHGSTSPMKVLKMQFMATIRFENL